MPVMPKSLIGLAFGDPFSPTTFSGYSKHLFDAISNNGCDVIPASSRQIRLWDMLFGCADLQKLKTFRKPTLSPHWLWRESTVDAISQRVFRKLSNVGSEIPILQIGTHILPEEHSERAIYCVTDMTISQAVEAGTFTVQALRDTDFDKAIALQRRMFDAYEGIFVLSQWAKDSIVKEYGQDERKVVVIGAGANIPPLKPDAGKYSSKEILFVGIDWDRKGGPLLTDAFSLVREVFPDARLHIVGCSPNVNQPGVQIHGKLKRDVPQHVELLHDLYRRANCFSILPDFDPFPNVLLEAQMTRTPVVSLRTGSREDAVRNNVSAFLVEDRSAKDVAAALISVLENSQAAEAMGDAGFEFVSEHYTWDRIANKVLTLIGPEPSPVLQVAQSR